MATRKPKEVAPVAKTVRKKATTKSTEKTAKDIANEKGEPYVNIVSIELDPDDVGNGAIELDWNDKFIIQLVRAGYQSKPNEEESIIVDRWFQTVCRNVLAENFEQWQANQTTGRTATREDLGDGKTGVS